MLFGVLYQSDGERTFFDTETVMLLISRGEKEQRVAFVLVDQHRSMETSSKNIEKKTPKRHSFHETVS
jgi:hypothetical protein